MACVYFIAGEGISRVKIGYTDGNPVLRLASLQVGSPVALRLLATVEAPHPCVEKFVHVLCRQDWIHGEWFNQSEDLMQMIDRIAVSYVPPLPRAAPKCGKKLFAPKKYGPPEKKSGEPRKRGRPRITEPRPWEIEGISRATYDRRRAAQREKK